MADFEANNFSQEFEDDLEDDLLREILYDESPFLLMPQEITSDSFDSTSLNNLISNLYSGPTITDIEAALTASSYTNNTHDFLSLDRISDMERGASRVENKYILQIKGNGNVMADDGYKWRKYGQKSIKNSSNPRSYYKCTNPRCGAKKQVERSNEDPDTLIITYEGLHLHYMYPFFVFGQPENPYNPPTKKSRKFNVESGVHQNHQQPTKDSEESKRHVSTDEQSTILTGYQEASHEVAISSQGLLEDMVPLLIRKPMIYTANSSKSSSSSSYPSPPTSPSFPWSPIY